MIIKRKNQVSNASYMKSTPIVLIIHSLSNGEEFKKILLSKRPNSSQKQVEKSNVKNKITYSKREERRGHCEGIFWIILFFGVFSYSYIEYLTNIEYNLYVIIMDRVLSIISFMTTFVILMLLSIFEVSTIWGSIDCCINNWCIILMFKCEDKMFRILCCNGEGVNISDNCLSCCSLNICCPIDLQQSVGKCANPVSEQDETTPTGMTISTEYEMIKTNEFSQQEQSVILVTK
eukprot:385081_1